MRIIVTVVAMSITVTVCSTAQAFCGFYVSRADTELYNQASQVVMVRDGDRTVITMANDFSGDAADFAVVIPVPTAVAREQINVGDRSVIEHLDAYTAPRLVEYHDPDPCTRFQRFDRMVESSATPSGAGGSARARGVTIEASYTVGEYDILILSATQSDGLVRWLDENGYRLPKGADAVVGSYIKQGMRFFVARVNLEEQARLGFSFLRPLQVAFESRRFMLPIRLGTLNAVGKQELFIYALTRSGRVETTNYRTVSIPSNLDIPEFVEHEFADFYRAMFDARVRAENERAVFLEYAWDMAWCDPCAADPLSAAELRSLGVFWVDDKPMPEPARIAPAHDVFVTRLHLRYDAAHFPEDLMLQETGSRQNFQGRYVLRRPWTGATSCDTSDYDARVRQRQEREAEQLARLTGWDIEDIRGKIDFAGRGRPGVPREPWWKRIWNQASN